MALRQGPARRRSRSHLPAYVRVRRALLVVVDLHAFVSKSSAATTLPCWGGNRSLHHRSWNRVFVLLLGPGHLRAEELWPRRRRLGADYLPRRLWCLSPCGRGLRSNVE